MPYVHTIGLRRYQFDDLRTLLARAGPARSGDRLAGIMAATAQERVAAQMALAEVSLTRFLSEVIIPYEDDEVTRLIIDTHTAQRRSRRSATSRSVTFATGCSAMPPAPTR